MFRRLGAHRPLTLLALTLTLGACEPATPQGPTPPVLDPIEREALLVWRVTDATRSLGPAASAAVAEMRPNGILAGGSAGAWLSGDGDNPALAQVLTWALDAQDATGVPLTLGVETPMLPGEVAQACFDPSDPTADPALAAIQTGMISLLEAWPEIASVMPDPTLDSRYWEVECTCTPCDSTDAAGMSSRARVLWSTALEEIAVRQRDAWWWHHAPDTIDEGAPETTPALPRQSLDLLLADAIGPQVPLRAAAGRGGAGPWAPVDPVLASSSERRVAGSLDVAAAAYGPTDALLLSPLDVYAQMREERSRGVTAWFAEVDGGGRTAVGTLEQLDLKLVERAFRSPSSAPAEVFAEAVAERLALDEEDARFMGRALSETGHALDLATHPTGVPIAGYGGPIPAALPLQFDSPAVFDGAWQDRVDALLSPDLDALRAVNQWAMEAALATSVALGELNTQQERLDPVDEALLRRRLKTTDFAVRAWGRLAVADSTLRALDAGYDEPRLAGWLADDIITLEFLADEVDGAVASGAIADPHPVVSGNLRAIADQLRGSAGPAEALARDFPVLYRARHDFVDGRVNYYWTVNPPGKGWVERGTSWPAYDEMSDVGEDDATWWHAWTTGVPSDTKVTWRACTETLDGASVCSSDRVLWTPL
ncbi:MAG: hypothetical protein KDA24_19370 [Deltaproteobacteria bacterium]|nr:hypothetical protein [Deltaproteobacteria bacterium]